MDFKGHWSSEPASVRFFIDKPFWKTSWFILIEVLGLTSILFGLMLIQNRRTRYRNKLIMRSFESEQKALQAQLNPHFIFNAMASFQELLFSGKYDKAKLNLSKLATLLRRVLANSRVKKISLEEEIENLETYLNLEKLRFDDALEWSMKSSPEIDEEMTQIPPMLIQPFVENAIWHGIMPLGKGKVEIEFQNQNKFLVCSIVDDGIGIEASTTNKGMYHHKPVGMSIVSERIALLNKYRNSKIRMEIKDRQKESDKNSGTKVLLYFPHNY